MSVLFIHFFTCLLLPSIEKFLQQHSYHLEMMLLEFDSSYELLRRTTAYSVQTQICGTFSKQSNFKNIDLYVTYIKWKLLCSLNMFSLIELIQKSIIHSSLDSTPSWIVIIFLSPHEGVTLGKHSSSTKIELLCSGSTFLLLLRFISYGRHLELGWLLKLFSCSCTSSFLSISFNIWCFLRYLQTDSQINPHTHTVKLNPSCYGVCN